MLSWHLVLSFARRFLDDPDFVVGQAVELVHELVDLPIRRVNLTLEYSLVVGRLRRSGYDPVHPICKDTPQYARACRKRIQDPCCRWGIGQWGNPQKKSQRGNRSQGGTERKIQSPENS